MNRLLRLSDRLSDAGGVLSGVMICAGVCLVSAEIIMRTFFSSTLYITEEYSGYLMAALTFLALGYTLRHKGHIRMTFLHHVLKGRGRMVLDMICFAVGFSFLLLLAWVTSLFFLDSLASGTRSMQISETPLAIPQFFLPAGCFIMAIQFAAGFFRSLEAWRKGETAEEEESIELGR
ncbi:MAG: TRAP transporter small permease [Thermovirgaceae bacterium]|nr:TRAP transporter small permease [Thermovirgaceae bacterium]